MRVERKKTKHAARLAALFLAVGAVGAAGAGASPEPGEPAEIKVRGFGFFKNFELRTALRLLLDDGARRETLDANFVEDAALVLNSELVEQGFFAAAVEAVWIDAEGRPGRATLDAMLSDPLERPLAIRELRLEARPGVRAVVEKVEISGLTVLAPEEATRFFRPTTGLYTPDSARAWSPARTRSATDRLREALRARGRAEARVKIVGEELDRATGAVELRIEVVEGPLWRITDWRVDLEGGPGAPPLVAPARMVGETWTRDWALDAGQSARREYYKRGYADARAAWVPEAPPVPPGAAERPATAVARVAPGEPRTLGEAAFTGSEKTSRKLLRSRANLTPGGPYNPEEIDAARLRLARLGVFRRIDVDETDSATEPGERDAIFRLTPEPSWQASWMLGYGSYEQVRGAVELSRSNLWGLAHRDRVEVTQSMKSTTGEYRYTVPTLFHDTVEGTGRIFGLRREEQSFVRQEYGASTEAAREVPWIDARGTAGLTYEVLRADDVELGTSPDEATETTVSAFNLGLVRDRRDNPIMPRAGYRWSVRSETALPELGSEVGYERLELAASWHRALGEDRWLHLGVSHGFITQGEGETPVNKLFFPGGESSNRGYQEGEATQRDASGRFVGVRSTWLVNAEFEQLVTGRWTAVVFSDTSGTATDMNNWPGDEVLTALGLGIRYHSPIGPVRLEYGRNLNPRDGDPSGTLHFSIGFPF